MNQWNSGTILLSVSLPRFHSLVDHRPVWWSDLQSYLENLQIYIQLPETDNVWMHFVNTQRLSTRPKGLAWFTAISGWKLPMPATPLSLFIVTAHCFFHLQQRQERVCKESFNSLLVSDVFQVGDWKALDSLIKYIKCNVCTLYVPLHTKMSTINSKKCKHICTGWSVI